MMPLVSQSFGLQYGQTPKESWIINYLLGSTMLQCKDLRKFGSELLCRTWVQVACRRRSSCVFVQTHVAINLNWRS